MRFQHKTIYCRNFTRYNPDLLCADLRKEKWEHFYRIQDANSAWKYLYDVLLRLFNVHAPLIEKRVKGRPCPWLSADVKAKMNDRDKLLRKARKTNSELDWSKYKRSKNLCTNAVRSAKSKYFVWSLDVQFKNMKPCTLSQL